MVVSPDAGGVHRAELFAKRLGRSLAIVFKRRPEPDVSEVTDIVGDVDGKSRRRGRRHDLDRRHAGQSGRSDHGARRDEGLYGRHTRHLRRRRDRACSSDSEIEHVIVTNTIPFPDVSEHPKFVQLSIAQTFADAIKRITTNRSDLGAVHRRRAEKESEPAPRRTGARGSP